MRPDKEDSEVMNRICDRCGLKWGQHDFAEFINCQYNGVPLKDGGRFNINEARAITNRIADELEGVPGTDWLR